MNGIPFKKLLSTIGSLLSVAVLAGSYYHQLQTTSVEFMNDKEVKFSKHLEDADREIASDDAEVVEQSDKNDKEQIRVQEVLCDEHNKGLINGKWEVRTYTDVYGKPEDLTERQLKVKIKCVGKGRVILNNDPNQNYWISLWHQNGRLALFNSVDGGHEIIEAFKVPQPRRTTAKVSTYSSNALSVPRPHADANYGVSELMLKDFQPGEKFANVPKSQIHADMRLVGGTVISNMNVTVNGNIVLSLGDCALSENGVFACSSDQNTEELVAGIFYDGNTLRITQGSELKGAVIIFQSSESASESPSESPTEAPEYNPIVENGTPSMPLVEQSNPAQAQRQVDNENQIVSAPVDQMSDEEKQEAQEQEAQMRNQLAQNPVQDLSAI
ncbi:MAG: hypothetical protein WCG27_02185 [Pseudomonadota bacterium]